MRIPHLAAVLTLAVLAALAYRGQREAPGSETLPEPARAPTRTAPAASLEDGLERLLEATLAGRVPLDDLPDLGRRLTSLLNEHCALGDAETRREVGRVAARGLAAEIARSRPAGGTFRLTPQVREILRRQALKLAESLRLMLQDPSQRHEGVLQLQAVDFEAPAGFEKLPWRVMGGFDYREGEPLPALVKGLDGTKGAIAGYMMALGDVTGIREFLLVESQWSCCFGEPPEVHQVLVVRTPEGAPGVDLTASPVLVTGRLEVGEELEDGFVISVFRLLDASVRELDD